MLNKKLNKRAIDFASYFSPTLVKFLTVIMLLGAPDDVFGQESSDEFVPQLELKFQDDFNDDSRSKYQISGKEGAVSWEQGKLILGEGSAVSRKLDAGAWVRIELDLEWPVLGDDESNAEFQVRFVLDNNTSCFVRIRNKLENGMDSISLGLIDVEEKNGVPKRTIVREYVHKVAAPQSIAFEYRLGLVTTFSRNKNLFDAYIKNGRAKCIDVRLLANKNDFRIRKINCKLAPPREVALSESELNELSIAKEQNSRLSELFRSRKFDEMKTICEQVLQIRKRILGKQHQDYATSLNNLALVYHSLGEYSKSAKLFHESNNAKEKIFGKSHPEYASGLNNLGGLYYSLGDFEKARLLLVNALEIRERVLGKEHPDCVASQNNLAGVFADLTEYSKAEHLYLESMRQNKKIFGREHAEYASSMHNLGALYYSMGDYERAKRYYLEAKVLRKKLFGKVYPDYASTLSNLAGLYYSTGNYAEAEPLLLESIEIREKLLGKDHPDYADTLNNLAVIYLAIGNYAKATPLFEQVKDIREQAFGKDSIAYALSLMNLGLLTHNMGDYDNAEPFYLEAKNILGSKLGTVHPDYINCVINLASNFLELGEETKAEGLYLEALKTYDNLPGAKTEKYAACLSGLAKVYLNMGLYDKAEPILLKAAAITENSLENYHPRHADNVNNLALFYKARGEHERADKYFKKALQITRSNLERYAAMQNEQQQRQLISAFNNRIGSYFNNAMQLGDRGIEVWGQAINWKGILVLRHKRHRILSNSSATRDAFAELNQVKSQLTRHFLNDPASKQWDERKNELLLRRESLENQLSRAAKNARIDLLENVDFSIRLQPGTCLIDFRRITFDELESDRPTFFVTRSHIACFILLDNGKMKLLDLGPAEKIENAISRWRGPIESANAAVRPLDDEELKAIEAAGQELRKLIWEPLEEHIGDSELVIVSPDAALGRMPLIALPGKEPGTYLIEEKKIVYLPVPALLPQMLSEPAKPIDGSVKSLLVGGIDYGQSAGEETPDLLAYKNRNILGSLKFEALENSSTEVDAIKARFNEPTVLNSNTASESAFKQQVANHQVLHIATHGFFASPDKFMRELPPDENQWSIGTKEQLKVLTENPDLLSGLAFADANNASSKSIDDAEDDGVLFSAEIAMIPMEHVELAVLSACDTAIGQDSAPGEGLIGIQRAFQVAGAKSTVASYWKVNDMATQMLMNKFYENLIKYSAEAKAKGEQGSNTTVRINALRDAQIWMLRELDEQDVELLTRGPDKKTRLADVEIKKVRNNTSGKTENIAHPRYWAAFVLSGDWR